MFGEKSALELEDEELTAMLEELQSAFQVDLTGPALQDTHTLGDLFDCIMNQMGPLGEPRCLTSAAFFRLRKVLADCKGLDRKTIRPETPLREILPWHARRRDWGSLQSALHLKFPALACGSLLLFSLLPASAAIALLIARLAALPSLVLGALLPLAWLGLLLLTRPLQRSLPCETVGDLARDVAANNHVTLAAAIGGTTHRQVFQSFQRIVARYAGQPLLRIERDTRLS